MSRPAPQIVFGPDRETRRRTRFGMGTSVVVHTLLVLWLVFHPSTAAEREPITEIALVDPGTLGGAGWGGDPGGSPSGPPAPARPAPADPEPTAPPARVTSRGPETRFARVAPAAPFAPEPQSSQANADRVQARIAALQAAASPNPTEWAATAAPQASPALWGTPAGAAGTGGSAPIALHRGGTGDGMGRGSGSGSGVGPGGGNGPVISLRRGTGSGNGSGSGALTALATAGLPGTGVEAVTARPAAAEGAIARRTLAGASLAGPIADRPIRSFERPVYPDWAKKDGVEGSVTLDFVVLPDGRVKENIMVQKTAGFADFDLNAVNALAAWRFEPLPAGKTGEQWGAITFHYRLRDAAAGGR